MCIFVFFKYLLILHSFMTPKDNNTCTLLLLLQHLLIYAQMKNLYHLYNMNFSTYIIPLLKRKGKTFTFTVGLP